MRLSNTQAVARPTPIDRNGITRVFGYFVGAVAPHTLITRWTYTVPAGKKAYIDVGFCSLIRDAVATTASKAQSQLHITPSGGVDSELFRAEIFTNVVGDARQLPVGSLGSLQTGDLVNGLTADPSVAGTVEYHIAIKLTEFDS